VSTVAAHLEELVMRRIHASIVVAVLAFAVQAAELPYNESANAAADLQRALAAAQANSNDVLVVFGANWCPDCRELDKALNGSSHALIAGRFQVVKVNVGRFDKNLDLANQYGNPIKMGIPAVVVLTADNRIVYSSNGGELANARNMGDTGIYDFLSSHVAAAH
jgi:thioredoxin 1